MEFHSSQPNARPIVTETGHIRIKDPKTNVTYTGLLWSQLVERAPAFFSAVHKEVRNREKYGSVVHAHFVKMHQDRQEARPVFSQALFLFTYFMYLDFRGWGTEAKCILYCILPNC